MKNVKNKRIAPQIIWVKNKIESIVFCITWLAYEFMIIFQDKPTNIQIENNVKGSFPRFLVTVLCVIIAITQKRLSKEVIVAVEDYVFPGWLNQVLIILIKVATLITITLMCIVCLTNI